MWHCTIPCRKSLLQLTYMHQFTNSCNMIYIYMYVLDAYAAYYIYIRRKVFKLVPRRERVNVYIYIHYIQYVGCLSGTWTTLLFGKCWFSSSMGAEISLPPNCDDVAPSMLSSWDIINPYRNQSPTQIGDNRSVFSDLIINMFHHCGCGNSSNPSLQW